MQNQEKQKQKLQLKFNLIIYIVFCLLFIHYSESKCKQFQFHYNYFTKINSNKHTFAKYDNNNMHIAKSLADCKMYLRFGKDSMC